MAVKVLDAFEFVDDSREGNRWPEEWFDGGIRRITVDLLQVNPTDPELGKTLSLRRQSVRSAAKSRGMTLKFNWQLDKEGNTVACVMQAVKDKAAAAKAK